MATQRPPRPRRNIRTETGVGRVRISRYSLRQCVSVLTGADYSDPARVDTFIEAALGSYSDVGNSVSVLDRIRRCNTPAKFPYYSNISLPEDSPLFQDSRNWNRGDVKYFMRLFRWYFADAAPFRWVESFSTGCCGMVGHGQSEVLAKAAIGKIAPPEEWWKGFGKSSVASGHMVALSSDVANQLRDKLTELGYTVTDFEGASVALYVNDAEARKFHTKPFDMSVITGPGKLRYDATKRQWVDGTDNKKSSKSLPIRRVSQTGFRKTVTHHYGFTAPNAVAAMSSCASPVETVILRSYGNPLPAARGDDNPQGHCPSSKAQISDHYDDLVAIGFQPLTADGLPYLNTHYARLGNAPHWLMPMARQNPKWKPTK